MAYDFLFGIIPLTVVVWFEIQNQRMAVFTNIGTVRRNAGKSGGGPPQSKTLARGTMIPELREASWTAPAPWCFAKNESQSEPMSN
jgi:hypothetical protein